MKRQTRILLGVSVALITAANLHFTVGDRFHHRAFGRHGSMHCGGNWNHKNQDLKTKAPQSETEHQFN
ncbi:hypothetical protein [Dyadobacter aurulentus]|uniref:hypothetical protein n=1 Tax=Dyadobacter sp. UC 10 TaxID=2605428 RepID=UPI0011F1A780|nr:hypothetical protein [Dyadobacter sp. UC 10]KAA0989499.1 hypothetical protein FXO21_04650 [Dyadobacter sp. UC 10]